MRIEQILRIQGCALLPVNQDQICILADRNLSFALQTKPSGRLQGEHSSEQREVDISLKMSVLQHDQQCALRSGYTAPDFKKIIG